MDTRGQNLGAILVDWWFLPRSSITTTTRQYLLRCNMQTVGEHASSRLLVARHSDSEGVLKMGMTSSAHRVFGLLVNEIVIIPSDAGI